MSFLKAIYLPVKVNSVEEYFALPKQDREVHGFYRIPYALPWERFQSTETGWDAFYKKIKKEYPVQYFFRHWLPSLDNPIVSIFKRYVSWPLNDLKYNIIRWIKPVHPRWRKSLPRHKYADISHLIVESNFALICDFYHEEVVSGWVDWESDEPHKTFYNKLVEYVNWIEKERSKIEDSYWEAMDISGKNVEPTSYSIKYAEPNKIETLRLSKETEILTWFINNRGFFWS